MPIFDGCELLICGTFAGHSHKSIEGDFVRLGGKLTKDAHSAALTHVLLSPKEVSQPSAKVQVALSRASSTSAAINFISIDWLLESVRQTKRLDEAAFDVRSVGAAAVAPPSSGRRSARVGKVNAPVKRERSPTPAKVESEDEDAVEDEEEEDKPLLIKVEVNGTVPVHPRFPDRGSSHVLQREGAHLDATLNLTNLAKNANKFYIIQAIESDDGKQYWAYNVWGRVGEPGQHAVFGPFAAAHEAIELFDKKFVLKTGLEWDERAEGAVPGKYTLIQTVLEEDDKVKEEAEDGPSSSKKVKLEDQPPPPSHLPESVQSLMKLIFDKAAIERTMSSFEYDARKLPLGKLANSTIEKGYATLKDVAVVVAEPQTAWATYNTSPKQALLRLTNQYYTLIPHAFGRSRGPVIDTQDKLKREVELVDALTNLKITASLMAPPSASSHPLDSQHQSLNSALDPIDSTSSEFDILQKMLLNPIEGEMAMWKLELVDAFTVERAVEKSAWDEGMGSEGKGERRLLWHGSQASNFGGILSQGLRIAPAAAPRSGYMFGKGCYLASLPSKASSYCYSQVSGGQGLLCLVEAQLGPAPFYRLEKAEFEAEEESRKAGFLATHAVGRIQPSEWDDAALLNPELAGARVASHSKAAKSDAQSKSQLLHDEFVVYDPSQLRLRYVCRVNFVY